MPICVIMIKVFIWVEGEWTNIHHIQWKYSSSLSSSSSSSLAIPWWVARGCMSMRGCGMMPASSSSAASISSFLAACSSSFSSSTISLSSYYSSPPLSLATAASSLFWFTWLLFEFELSQLPTCGKIVEIVWLSPSYGCGFTSIELVLLLLVATTGFAIYYLFS